MGHPGCLVAFENRDQDYSGYARILGRVHQVLIALGVRPGVVSLGAGRVGREARGAGNHSLGPGFGCQGPLQRSGVIEVGDYIVRYPEGFEFGAVAGRPDHGPDPGPSFEEGPDDRRPQGSRGSDHRDYSCFHELLILPGKKLRPGVAESPLTPSGLEFARRAMAQTAL